MNCGASELAGAVVLCSGQRDAAWLMQAGEQSLIIVGKGLPFLLG
jgi:hypothetical protein